MKKIDPTQVKHTTTYEHHPVGIKVAVVTLNSGIRKFYVNDTEVEHASVIDNGITRDIVITLRRPSRQPDLGALAHDFGPRGLPTEDDAAAAGAWRF